MPWWRREKGATGWSEQQGMAPQEGPGGGWEKLCRLAMAAKAVAPAAAERRRAKACAREFQREPVDAESSGARLWSSRARGGAWHGGWTRVGHGGGALGAWLPRCHSVEHVARAMEPDLESVFGIFRAHSDLGAINKVALLRILYKLD